MKLRAVTYAGAAVGVSLLVRSIVRRWTAYDLRGKVVLITGGSRGLGLVLARELVARGAKVAICARDEDELARAHVDLVRRGGHVLAVRCDITDRAQLAGLVAETEQQLGPVDVLVNNASVIQVGPMTLMTTRDYEKAMATHFWGPLHLMLALIPKMLERGGGRIVNITSIGGKVPMPHLLPYTASKFALVGLSEGMRTELMKDGIYVTTVVPGLMRTGSPVNATFKGQHRAEYAWFSITDSLHITSMQAERAARKIIDAMRHGTPEVVLSIQAKAVAKLNALVPSTIQRLLSLFDRLLPKPGGIGQNAALGLVSRSPKTPAFLTRASDRAARRNNEFL